MSTERPLRIDSALTIPEHVLTRRAAGEMVLLSLDTEMYYGLEGVGPRFWELLEAGTTLDRAVTTLATEYDVARDALMVDLRGLVDDLRRNGLVVIDSQ